MPEMAAETEQIAALLAEATPDAATRLRALAETTADKETRKAARRALYRLQQAGILPADRAAPAQTPESRAEKADETRAYASAFDGAGNCLLFFVLSDPDGGSPSFVQLLMNDGEGVTSFNGQRTPRREVEARIAQYELQLEQGLALAEVEADYGRWLLAEGRAISRRLRRETPPGLLDWLPRIGEPRGECAVTPVPNYFDADAIRADTSIDRSAASLFALPWFDAWFFAVEEVLPWVQAWEQTGSSAIVLPDNVKQERRERILTEAITALMTPEMQANYVRRLEQSADILRRRGKEAAAKQALYHALALSEEKQITESPFARALVQRSLEAVLEMIQNRNQA
jgi:hypothetical protein